MSSQDENVRKQARSYLKQARLGRKTCNTCQTADLTEDADADVLITASNNFQQRVKVLDGQALRLKRQKFLNPNLDIQPQLAQLQQQKDAIADDLVAFLSARLSNHAKLELRRFIQEHIKKNIQLN